LYDDVGALVAVEQRGQHLDLVVRLQQVRTEHGAHARFDQADVAVEVGERRGQLEIGDDALQGVMQPVLGRIVDAVGRLRAVGLDVFGRDRAPHEDEVVVEIGAVQDGAADRVEEGLGQLRLLVVDQQADVMQLHLAPDFAADFLRLVFVFQRLHAFLYPLVVEGDSFPRLGLRRFPVAGFEIALGILAGGTKQAVMLVEAVEDGARDVERDLGTEQLWK
jgi:hypothetical protein